MMRVRNMTNRWNLPRTSAASDTSCVTVRNSPSSESTVGRFSRAYASGWMIVHLQRVHSRTSRAIVSLATVNMV